MVINLYNVNGHSSIIFIDKEGQLLYQFVYKQRTVSRVAPLYII
jgi:sensor domain CHASE-containing protein